MRPLKCIDFFSQTGVLEMQFIPLHNNYFFSLSNHGFHPPRNGREALGDAQHRAESAPNLLLFVTRLLAEVMNCPQVIFPSESRSVLFAVSTWTLPFHPATKLPHSLKGCGDRSHNTQVSPSTLTTQGC